MSQLPLDGVLYDVLPERAGPDVSYRRAQARDRKKLLQEGALMLGLRLYMFQRLSALLMAPFVIGHLAVMIYAIQGGLSTAEILGRTQGSVLWFLFYGIFLVAVSIHGAIGLRAIAHEWGGVKGAPLEGFMWLAGLGLFALGARAVWAVTFAQGAGV
jgi:fumarate reductase subunit C